MNALQMIGRRGFDAATNGAALAAEGIIEGTVTLVDTAGNVIAEGVPATFTETLGDKVKKVATNKYVIGSVAAVAVAAAAYGTYRFLNRDKKKVTKKDKGHDFMKSAEHVVEMTEDQAAEAVELARANLQAAEAVLTKSKAKKAGKKDTAAA
jgi:hypothetical protein